MLFQAINQCKRLSGAVGSFCSASVGPSKIGAIDQSRLKAHVLRPGKAGALLAPTAAATLGFCTARQRSIFAVNIEFRAASCLLRPN